MAIKYTAYSNPDSPYNEPLMVIEGFENYPFSYRNLILTRNVANLDQPIDVRYEINFLIQQDNPPPEFYELCRKLAIQLVVGV